MRRGKMKKMRMNVVSHFESRVKKLEGYEGEECSLALCLGSFDVLKNSYRGFRWGGLIFFFIMRRLGGTFILPSSKVRMKR